jgi:hypothetical protein
VIHYHGTPITPREKLLALPGRHFCVSFATPRDLAPCLEIGASVMGDNGAFTVHTRGGVLDVPGYYRWLAPWLRHPHWAVVPDVIGGDTDAQRRLARTWAFDRSLGAPVWHLHRCFDYLRELADSWPRICFGSSAEFWNPRTDAWRRRVDDAFNVLARRGHIPWVHMLRAMGEASRGPWPFASADSTNVAQNHSKHRLTVDLFADDVDRRNPPQLWRDTTIPAMEFM